METPWGKSSVKRSTTFAFSAYRKVLCGLFCVISLCLASPASPEENRPPESFYTSISPVNCHIPAPPVVNAYEVRGLTVQECPAPKGWRLFIASTDERSWPELSNDAHLWSTEEQVVYRNDFGNFPNLGADMVEWRVSASGRPCALIFRISAQAPVPPDSASITKTLSKLFVIRLADGTPRFCGVVQTNREARELADKAAPGAPPLSHHHLP
jgi:hypothetical protein